MKEMTVLKGTNDPGLKAFENYADKSRGYFYILEYRNGTIKIGRTAHPTARIASLECSAQNYAQSETGRIAISDAHPTYGKSEKILHNTFDKCRIKGTELFKCDFDTAVGVGNHLSEKIKVKPRPVRAECADGMNILQFLRDIEREDLMIAAAVLEGMRLQKMVETQRQAGKPKEV